MVLQSRKWLPLALATIALSGVLPIIYLLLFRKKKTKSVVSPKANQPLKWSPEKYDVTIVDSCETWARVFLENEDDFCRRNILGFDCEWVTERSGNVGKVALLQIATQRDRCFLIRLPLLEDIPESLRQMLSDRSVLKLGVACLEDAKKLFRDYGLHVNGCVDLRNLALRRGYKDKGKFGLKGLALDLLGVELCKDDNIRRGDWDQETLSPAQILYAAWDALVAVYIFKCLLGIDVTLSGISIPSSGSWSDVCQGLIDVNFKGKSKFSAHQKQPQLVSEADADGPRPSGRAFSARRKPLYHNCQLLAPDGQLLCTCDVKKAQWYIEKGVGVETCADPLTVRLKFEPAGRPANEANYYLQPKRNVCVVCGSEDSYTRKHIIPHEYRRHFPSMMKNHRSHDVLLLCVSCHQRSSAYEGRLKDELAAKCHQATTNGDAATKADCKFVQDADANKVRSAAKALLTRASWLPVARKEELERVVRSYYGVEESDQELLKQAAALDSKIPNSSYVRHGFQVVRYVMEHEGLVEFEKFWRRQFLENMRPKFLPELWSVDHAHDELREKEDVIMRTLETPTHSITNLDGWTSFDSDETEDDNRDESVGNFEVDEDSD